MDSSGLIQIVLYLVLLTALTPIIGEYMARVFSGGKTVAPTVIGPLERGIYRVCGVDPAREQHWTGYAASLLAFNLLGVLLLYAILRLQAFLPLNPAGMTAMTPDLAFNTAVSFTTNTNWQSYSGEAALSYLSQMAGLTVQNFVSAATGMAVLVALIRGFSRRSARTVGNFWVDMVRATLYVLLPLSIVTALFLVWQGVPQNLNAYVTAETVEGAQQVIAQGPAASQIAIKQIGSNGGGFFGINSAHPYENPTPLSNLVEMLQILLIASGLTWTFGRMVGDLRQGVALFAAMGLMLVVGIGVTAWAEGRPNPAMVAAGAGQYRRQHGRQGGPLRHRQLGAMGGRDHGRVERLGQCDARQLLRAGRHGADGQHDAGRGGVRRRRRRPLRHDGLRPAGRLHRRADGRANARIPGQEDRGEGDQAGDVRGA